MPSCLFGGPPVRDDIIKLAESQIGFMNIFARPLFEAVADILPAMRYAVDEMLINSSTWEKKIETEREKRRSKPKMSLGLLPLPSFSVDPTPSPFSGGPLKQLPQLPQPNRSAPPLQEVSLENTDRRGSGGSFQLVMSTSQRSSVGLDKESRRSSGAGIVGTRHRENQSQSRRGSGDASLTAILVTQTPNAHDTSGSSETNGNSDSRSKSPVDRKDTLMKASSTPKKDKESARPVTAPSHARRSQGKITSPKLPSYFISPRPLGAGPDFDPATKLFPTPRSSSQNRSNVDLPQTANGNLDGSKIHQWETTKLSGDSNISRSDGSRDPVRKPDWWRQMGSRLRTKDVRNGDQETHGYQQEIALAPTVSNSTTDANSPITTSPGRSSRTDKLKSFFKRKQRGTNSQEKQLSSYGSSSQLRTPPTSDPGRSLNSDE
jgi:hypothetical protein